MRLKKIPIIIDFDESIRSKVVMTAGVRLDSKGHYIKLVETSSGYSIAANLSAKILARNPNNAKQWLGFECVVENSYDEYDRTMVVTGVGFRLHNETNEYWHNGTAWVINTSNWNTEAEIANNISTFTVANKKIGVVINLTTTDATKTPIVKAVKFLYSSDIEHQDDYIYRTIVRQLSAQLRPMTDYPIVITSMSSVSPTIDLKNTYPLQTPYDIIDIDAVFNHTDDPDHSIDLRQSYNPTTQVITLSSPIEVGDKAWIRIIYRPEVAITTGLEYHELERVPAVVLSNIALNNMMELSSNEFVLNKSTLIGVNIFPPKRRDIEIAMSIVTDSARDQVRLADEVKRFFDNNPMLTSWGLGEDFALKLLSDYNTQNLISTNGVQTGNFRFSLMGTLYYERDAVDVHAIENFRITGDVDVTI